MKIEVESVVGSKLKIFRLINNHHSYLEVSNYGARIISWFVPSGLSESKNIVIGSKSLIDYRGNGAYFGATIGPVAGRISQGIYHDGEKNYYLDQNEGQNTLHGGKDSFEAQVWQSQLLKKKNEVSVIFSYRRPAGKNGFPGELIVKVIHTLTKNHEWSIRYYAKTNQRTLFNPTNHVYFNLGNQNTSIANHRLFLESDYFMPLNQERVPTGEWRPVERSAFDFKNKLKGSYLSQGLTSCEQQNHIVNGIDHPFILNHQRKYQGILTEESSGITIVMTTTAPAVVVYTTNIGNEEINMAGKKILNHQGVTLETQRPPNGSQNKNYNPIILKPETMFFSQTSYRAIELNK